MAVKLSTKIPNGRMVPARIRHKGHTYSGKVKRVNGRVKIFVTPEVARKINPEARRRWTIAAIKAANKAADYHFFDRKTMQFFNSKVVSSVQQGPGGVFFVTSEKYGDGPTSYKVRQFNEATANIRTVEDFNFKDTALTKARMLSR